MPVAGQPLANLHIKGDTDFGPLGLQFSSERLMAIVAKVIAEWSLAQAHLGSAFAELIGTRSPATTSIYASFDSFAVQRQMLVTAAMELLPRRSADVFRALLVIVERAAKERHRFAHWAWGSFLDRSLSDEFLLLANPKQFWRLRARQIKHFKRFKLDTRSAHATQPCLDPKDILAYREDDLWRVKRQMETASQCAYILECLARATPTQRLGIQRQLLAQPVVRTEFDKIHLRKAKPPKTIPKQPNLSKRAKREAALARRRTNAA